MYVCMCVCVCECVCVCVCVCEGDTRVQLKILSTSFMLAGGSSGSPGDMRRVTVLQKWTFIYQFQQYYLPVLYGLLGLKVRISGAQRCRSGDSQL